MTDMTALDSLEQWAAEETESSPPRGALESHDDVVEVAGPVVRTDPRPARAVTPITTVPHNSPPPTQGRVSKRGRSSEHGGQGKKHKTGRGHGQARSPTLDLLGLSDQDCARFKERPFEVMAEAMKAADTLLMKYREGEADRLEEMREERDSLLQRLKEVDPQIRALAENERKLKEAEEQIVEQVTARTEAEAARAEAEAARAEAEAAKDRALAEKAKFEREVEKEIGRLTSLNKDLYAQNASLKGDLTAMEQDRDKYQGRFKELLTKAKEAADLQFENAVKQVKLLNPGLAIDPKIVCSSHRVVDQEIILPERVAKGQVVQERAVIFRAPDA